MTTNTNTDPLAGIAIQDARVAVAESGELVAVDGPHFLVDGDWLPYFISNSRDEDGIPSHPDVAKVTVTRKGQEPRDVVITWDESFRRAETDGSRALWLEQPMTMFGAAVERHGYRVVFGDVLAALIPATPATGGADPVPAGRDWIAEVQAITEAVPLDALYDEAREAGALASNAKLQAAFSAQLTKLMQKPKPVPAAAPVPAPAATKRPDAQPRSQGGGRRRGGRGRGGSSQKAA